MQKLSALSLMSAVVFSTAGFAEDLTPAELEELKADCKVEAEAVGMSGSDINAYIEECVDDFANANITNSEKGKAVE